MEHVNNNIEYMQILAGKTWDLLGKINEKITQNGFSFCSHCSKHGRHCVVAESSVEERDKMIAIRDSLGDFHHILIYLQRVKSSHKKQREEALANLQKSKKILMEKINNFQEKQRKIDVLEELITFLGDDKNDEFTKIDENIKVKKMQKTSNFLVNTSRFALEFALIFAGIFTTFELCKNRQHKVRFVAPFDSGNIHLDVLCGRG